MSSVNQGQTQREKRTKEQDSVWLTNAVTSNTVEEREGVGWKKRKTVRICR